MGLSSPEVQDNTTFDCNNPRLPRAQQSYVIPPELLLRIAKDLPDKDTFNTVAATCQDLRNELHPFVPGKPFHDVLLLASSYMSFEHAEKCPEHLRSRITKIVYIPCKFPRYVSCNNVKYHLLEKADFMTLSERSASGEISMDMVVPFIRSTSSDGYFSLNNSYRYTSITKVAQKSGENGPAETSESHFEQYKKQWHALEHVAGDKAFEFNRFRRLLRILPNINSAVFAGMSQLKEFAADLKFTNGAPLQFFLGKDPSEAFDSMLRVAGWFERGPTEIVFEDPLLLHRLSPPLVSYNDETRLYTHLRASFARVSRRVSTVTSLTLNDYEGKEDQIRQFLACFTGLKEFNVTLGVVSSHGMSYRSPEERVTCLRYQSCFRANHILRAVPSANIEVLRLKGFEVCAADVLAAISGLKTKLKILEVEDLVIRDNWKDSKASLDIAQVVEQLHKTDWVHLKSATINGKVYSFTSSYMCHS